jgi:hypothetical protein
VKKATLLLSVGLYLASLTQKCYCTESSCGDSIAVVISGLFGFLLGGAALTWLANPMLWFAWVSFNNAKRSLVASTISFALSLSFIFFDEVISDEAGHYSKILNYKAGYWLWLASAFTMVFGAYIHYLKEKESK